MLIYLPRLAIVLSITWLASCGVPKNFQHALYLQDSVTEAEKKVMQTATLIAPGDRLNIGITAINKEAADAFNLPAGGAGGNYLVDSNGNIQLLQLGIIKVEGLTTAQVAASLEQQLLPYIKGPVVIASIANFKINVFGEVARPGTIAVPDGKFTILEAIIQSGDLTIYGRRDNILVIREVNGQREFGRVDINSNRIFLSPYFNLKQNDIIYVEADKTKFISNDAITARNLRNLGIAITILSTALLIVNIFK